MVEAHVFFTRPRITILAVALIIVAGLSAHRILPRAEDPQLTNRFATVYATWDGADAATMESLVTDPIEDVLREIEEIGEINSSSVAGRTTVNIDLADEVTAVDEVWSRIRDKLGDVESDLPDGATAPVFEEMDSQAFSLIVGLSWARVDAPELTLLGRFADELADAFRRVPGTEDVEVFGQPEEELRVEVDPARLAAVGLTVDDVVATLRGGDAKVAAGTVHGDRNRLQIEVGGEFETIERVAHLPVREGADGRFLRIRDLGTVEKGHVDPPTSVALLAGRRGVLVAARMLDGRRIDDWAASARAALDRFGAVLPGGIEASVLFDQSRYTESRLGDLTWNFLAGALLVTIVVLLTMGWRSGVIVGAALPLTSMLVLVGMWLLDVPIDQMSVTGLVIALGLLIDNAIVVVDDVNRGLARGMTPAAAIRHAVRTLAVPLIGSTTTTVLAFMPIVLMPGPSGEFVGSIAVSVILALVGSLALALTVIPALAGFLQSVGSPAGTERVGWWNRGIGHAGAGRAFRAGLTRLLSRPALAIGIAFALPIAGFARFGTLEEQFFPPADRDQFELELRMPWQTSLAETERVAGIARTVVRDHPDVEEVTWAIGESVPRFYYNVIAGRRSLPYYAQALVQLRSSDRSIEVVAEVQRLLDDRLPGVQILAKQIEQGPPFDAPIEVRLYGPEIGTLRRLGTELRTELAAIGAVTQTRATMEAGQPKLALDLDEESARIAGIDARGVARRLVASTDGLVGGSMIESTEELPVRVRMRDRDRRQVAGVADVALAVEGGGWTPLSAIGSLRLVPEDASIPHRQNRRCNTVQAFVVAGTLPNTVVRELRERLETRGFVLPAGYELDWGGEAAERNEAVTELMASVSVLLVLMVAALVLSFNSFRHAGIIALVGIASVGLSLLSLSIFGWPFGFMAIVGTLGLVGVAVNDSIVVLAALRLDERARSGSVRAAANVVVDASRHLFSTTLTTAAGFLPLLLAGGGFWPPLATAIAGGVVGATLLAMTLVPSAFLLTCRRAQRERVEDVTFAPAPVPAV